MNARLERKLRVLPGLVAGGVVGGFAFVFAMGFTAPSIMAAGIAYGLLFSLSIGGISLFVLDGPMRVWLGSLSFTASLLVRSAIYAAVVIPLLFFQLGFVLAGQAVIPGHPLFWVSLVYAFGLLILFNLVLGIANIVGRRALLNFIVGRYHTPVEENRFVLFVDIAGSTELAERLGGIGIHRLLDRIFRLLSLAVVDYRGEVLNYVGDEVIVTWPEHRGAVDGRPLRCFVAMREELSRASGQFEREFGVSPRIRGSLHFGPVIVGEIGDIKRAIVFNGDVMNTAARLEQLSRNAEGGFLASGAAIRRFGAAPPVALRDLGQLPIRGRADAIDVFGLDGPASA